MLHHATEVVEIQEFWVNEKKRSLGYGKEIIKKVINILKEKGIFHIEICTNKTRERTQMFYKNQGFIENHYKYVIKL